MLGFGQWGFLVGCGFRVDSIPREVVEFGCFFGPGTAASSVGVAPGG